MLGELSRKISPRPSIMRVGRWLVFRKQMVCGFNGRLGQWWWGGGDSSHQNGIKRQKMSSALEAAPEKYHWQINAAGKNGC